MDYEIKRMLEKAETNYKQLTNRVDSLDPQALGKAINKFESVSDEMEELKNEVANLSATPRNAVKTAVAQGKKEKALKLKEFIFGDVKNYNHFLDQKGVVLDGNTALFEAELDTRILEQSIANTAVLSLIGSRSTNNLDYRRTVNTQRPAIQLTGENVGFTDITETDAVDYGFISGEFTKAYAYAWLTNESYELSDVEVEGNLKKQLAEQFALTMQSEVLHGDGTGSGTKADPQHLKGITNASIDRANVYVEALKPAATRARDILAAVSSGVADSIGADKDAILANLYKLLLTVPERSQAGSSWLMHPDTLSHLMQVLVDADGRSLIDIQGVTGSRGVWTQRFSLMGFPIALNETMDVAGAGTAPIVFGNFAEGYEMLTPSNSSHTRIDDITLPDVRKLYMGMYFGSIVADHEALAVLVCLV